MENALRIILCSLFSSLVFFLLIKKLIKNEKNALLYLYPFKTGRRENEKNGNSVSFDFLLLLELSIILITFFLGGHSYWLSFCMALAAFLSIMAVDSAFILSSFSFISINGVKVVSKRFVSLRLAIGIALSVSLSFFTGLICYILKYTLL